MAVTRDNIKQVRAGLEDRLNELGEELGLDLSLGNAKYGPTGRIQLDIASLDDSGRPETQESRNFALYCGRAGLEPEDLYGTFVSRGVEYRITGWNPRAPKNPLQVERVSDGTPFVWRIRPDGKFGYEVTRAPEVANA